MTGNGKHPIHGDFGDGLWHCFKHINNKNHNKNYKKWWVIGIYWEVFFTWFKHQTTTSFDGRFFVVLDFWTPEITSEIKGVSSTTWLCLKISLPWSILDQIFLGVHERNMSFTACCWKSWRKIKKHVEFFGGHIYLQSFMGAPIASSSQYNRFYPRILMAEPHGLCMNFQASSKPI